MMSDDFHIAVATHGSVVVRRVAARLCGESHALSADSDDVTVLLFSIFVFFQTRCRPNDVEHETLVPTSSLSSLLCLHHK